MCQVVGIQMDEFRMNELPPWAQNNLQRDTYVSINFNPPLLSFIGIPWASNVHKILPSANVTNTLLILINNVYKVSTH